MTMLRYARLIATVLFAIGLSACEGAAPPATAKAEPSQPQTVPTASAPESVSGDTITDPIPGANGMDKTCEGVTFRISADQTPADAGPDAARSTSLSRVDAAATAKQIAKPEEMSDYTAVGLGCAVATSDGKPYFVVQYGELPFGCQFCEWFYLYDADGTQLTRSTPSLLTDSSLPEGQQQSSNTREYEQATQKLGITHPELTYVK